MIRMRGEVFVIMALSAAWAAAAADAPAGPGTRPGLAADLLPPYAVSEAARREAEAQVTSPREGGDYDPSPSPDGTWLAFASTRDTPEPQVYRRAVAGGAVRRLTSGPGACVQPAVSPDGREIACAASAGGSWDIMVLPAEGGREAGLTSTPDLDEIHPAWHPSGEALAFSRRDPADGVWWICAKRRGAGSASRICEGLYPSWSPSGDRIVFQRARGRGRGKFVLWVVEVVEVAEYMETRGGGFAARGGVTEIHSSAEWGAVGPAFGPRGEWIAFAAVPLPERPFADPPRGGDIRMVRADGSGLRRVPTSRRLNWSPAWAGDSIFFSSEDDAGRAGTWSVAAGPSGRY